MEPEIRQPLDELMTKLDLSNAALVQASTEQLSFKNVQKGRKGQRLTPNIQEKILKALLKVKPDLKLSRRDLFRYEMDEDAVKKIHYASTLIRDRKIQFPQFVDLLAEAGVTRYSVEIAANRFTFFGIAGEAHIKQGPPINLPVSGIYDEDALRAAIVSIRNGQVDFPGFLDKIYGAGVLNYEVNVRARETRYFSESMTYKERIPQTAPEPVVSKRTPPSKKKSSKKKKSAPKKVSLKARKAAKRSWSKRRR